MTGRQLTGRGRDLADPHDVALLAAVRGALARPFVDPVAVLDLPLSRRAARALERVLLAGSA